MQHCEMFFAFPPLATPVACVPVVIEILEAKGARNKYSQNTTKHQNA